MSALVREADWWRPEPPVREPTAVLPAESGGLLPLRALMFFTPHHLVQAAGCARQSSARAHLR